MITSNELSQIQLQILIAQAGGAAPDDVVLFLVDDASDDANGEIRATVKTDLKGAQRLDRAINKGAK